MDVVDALGSIDETPHQVADCSPVASELAG